MTASVSIKHSKIIQFSCISRMMQGSEFKRECTSKSQIERLYYCSICKLAMPLSFSSNQLLHFYPFKTFWFVFIFSLCLHVCSGYELQRWHNEG